ncbi:MAG: peptidoglycan DD-metalloendopeptidase family protein [Clostridia bacterium]|nr:peptidoglycan DD-metalloendopeptidase family protein [Clostridia bacterium]
MTRPDLKNSIKKIREKLPKKAKPEQETEKAEEAPKPAKKKSSITWGAIFRRINEIVMDRVADIVTGIDKVLDMVAWGAERTSVLFLRKVHGFREGLMEHATILKRIFLFGVLSAVVIISVFMGAIDYTYSYHGRALGIVKEQSDVLQVLDLVSDGLTKEYGSTVTIDPEKDITFTPIISAGKEIDKPDTVLQKFTYMGDLPTTAYAIMIDGVQAATVQSEDAGNWVIDTIIDRYITGKREDYELVELSEPVEIVEKTVKLSSIQNQRDALAVIDDGISMTYTYTARQGDTPEIAARELGITVEELLAQNPITKDTAQLQEGQELRFTETNKTISVKTVGLETFTEVIPYETITQESSKYYEGDEVVSVEGQDGKQVVTSRVTRVDGELVSKEDLETEVLTPAVNKVVIKGTAERPPTVGSGRFIRPVPYTIHDKFGIRWGRMHEGIDMWDPGCYGAPVYAADGGTVVVSGWYYACGLTVIIDHGNGFKTLYAHASSLAVSVGDKVYQGQHISNIGSTGRSYSPHLHFEIWWNGKPVDPMLYIS